MNKRIEPEKTLHQAVSSIKSIAEPHPEQIHPISDEEFAPACQFVTQLVSQAHEYGASFVRLQDFMSRLPQMFGFYGAMLPASPFFFFEFWQHARAQPIRATVRLPAGSFDLAKLSHVGTLVNELVEGKVPIEEGKSRLKQIDSLSPPYKSAIVALGYAFCGAGFAVLLSAEWRDILFAALLSLVVYAITLIAARSQWLGNRLNFIAALAASMLASLLAILFPGSNAFTVSLCAIIVLIPGLALTLGIAELASNLVISGLSRLVDGILVTFALVVGNVLGSYLVNAIWPVPPPEATVAIPLWILLASVVVLMVGLGFAFQVRQNDMVWVILAGIFAYVGVLVGGELGNWQGSFLGALLLGLYTSLFVLRLHRPSSVVMLPGIMILVPGVAAYFGLNALQTGGIIDALPAVWGVVVQITAIISGLFIAASLLPQRASL